MPMKKAFLAVLLMTSASAARAQPEIALPLSHDGPLVSPPLRTSGLRPETAGTVARAIAAARQADRTARAAERVLTAARDAAAKAANSPGIAAGYGTFDIPLDGKACRYQGRARGGRASGLGVLSCAEQIFAGHFLDGRLNGLGGDTSLKTADAYEGAYRNGARMGYGIERDKDGSYPGQYGFRGKTNMELLGLQDFKDVHWAGRFGFYEGPKIACSLIKGAVLEGSVLDGHGAKFDAHGRLIEQGFYKLGLPQHGGPPC